MTSMNEVISLQKHLQTILSKRKGDTDPAELQFGTVGEFVDYIRATREAINMELEEILNLFPIEARKPWKSQHSFVRAQAIPQDIEETLRNEAMDVFCFTLNILLACGVDQRNIDDVFREVLNKNMTRAMGDY